MTGLPRCSVIVPAHDEARVVAACLAPLALPAASGEVEVVVVANGCTDDTAAVAAGFAGVRVVDVPTASKVAALNAGDAAAGSWPRVYLDADIRLTPGALDALARALTTDEPVVGSVTVHFDVEGRPWPVRAFCRAYAQTPYVTDHLVGLGVYGFSRSGRERFGAFPDLVADDLFVQRLFAPEDRRVLPGHRATVQVPRTLRALVAVRTRVARGNAELAAQAPDTGSRSTSSTLRALVRLVRQRRLLVTDVAVYMAVNATARLRARAASRGGRQLGPRWHRDSTTR